MKNILVNYGGIILFYIIVVFGVLSLCTNNMTNDNNSSFTTSYTISK
jgi:hypothetical protein